MNTLFTHGTITQVTQYPDGTIEKQVENIIESVPTKQTKTYDQSIFINSEQEAIAIFLNLVDKYKAGHVTDFGIQCLTDKDGSIKRVIKSWTV